MRMRTRGRDAVAACRELEELCMKYINYSLRVGGTQNYRAIDCE